VWMYTVVTQPWPLRTALAQVRLMPDALIRRHGILMGRWPYIRIRVRNGHAVYRIDTCDQGSFDAELVDYQYTHFQSPVTLNV
jgi:hypothetical protein